MTSLTENSRFKVNAMGFTETQVRLVVEYTAAGANSDDIKRKFTTLGIDRSAIGTAKTASIETAWAFNSDLVRSIDPAADEVASRIVRDVASALQQAAPDEPMQVSWVVHSIDEYNAPIREGTHLINAQEYSATVAVA
ncbi:hypothetical protein [Nocardioides sp. InS609-2]|uniref:hypothetical protein n=1 Tax=Nocardioides sp. InS609-2 TaxID=2760705 RepID=UPI0020C0B110|nr:hypothetical protein [Nocardioides sp. InS609-2]